MTEVGGNVAEIERLDAGWRKIVQQIANLGDQIRDTPMNVDPQRRADAYKAALASISESYVNQVHFNRAAPEALPTFGSIFNFGAPAPDFSYHLIHVEPGAEYRVWGWRGDAPLIDIQQLTGWFGRSETPAAAKALRNEPLDNGDIVFEPDGYFSFVMSAAATEGQWRYLDPNADTVFVREYFDDYAVQGRSSTINFDLISQPRVALSGDDMATRMAWMAYAIRDYMLFLNVSGRLNASGDNCFQEVHFGDVSMADQRYFQARYAAGPDEALIVTWQAPNDFRYWSAALYSDAYQALDFRNRQVNLNHALAETDAAGALVMVLSHHDLGYANWLDLSGREAGILLMRTKGASAFAMPTIDRVSADAVNDVLGGRGQRLRPEERMRQIETRRRHFQLRERR